MMIGIDDDDNQKKKKIIKQIKLQIKQIIKLKKLLILNLL